MAGAWRAPERWEGLEIFFLDADYVFKDGKTALRVQGVTPDLRPAMVELEGHYPNFYVRLIGDGVGAAEQEETVAFYLGTWEKAAREHISEYYSAKNRKWAASGLLATPRWIVGVETVKRQAVKGYARVFDCCKVSIVHPDLVRIFRDFLENPRGRREGGFVPDWTRNLPDRDRWIRISQNLVLYEANVDYVKRAICDMGLIPSSWYRLAKTRWKYRAHTFPGDFEGRFHRYDLWARAHVRHFVRSAAERPIPNLLICAYDIETDNQGGDYMSDPRYHQVLQIGNQVYREATSGDYRGVMFALGRFDPPPNVDELYCFDDERQLLLEWGAWFMRLRPNFWIGHNSNGFDLPFLLRRAETLGLPTNFSHIGLLPGKASYWERADIKKGVVKASAKVPGMIVADTRRIAQEGYQALETSLNFLAKDLLAHETKMDIAPSRITTLQKSIGGRKLLAEYCMQDVNLVRLIEQQRKDVLTSIVTSQRSTALQVLLNRSQKEKADMAILRRAMQEDPPAISIVPTFEKRLGHASLNVRGDYSGSKGYQGAVCIKPAGGYYISETVDADGLRWYILVLDFEGLYPSIIMSFNLCLSTLVYAETIARLGLDPEKDLWKCPDVADVDGRCVVTPGGPANPIFVRSHVKEGLIPRIEVDLKAERKKLKAEMWRIKQEIKRRLEADDLTLEERKMLELALKLADIAQLIVKQQMNSLYGTLALDAAELAATITRIARMLLLQTRDHVHDFFPGNDVIYGDTDSVFIAAKARSLAEATALGHAMAKRITAEMPPPVNLQFEKVFTVYGQRPGHKKNYMGTKYMVAPDGSVGEPEISASGYGFRKRNCPTFLAGVCEPILAIAVAETCEDRLAKMVAIMRGALIRLLRGDVGLTDIASSTKIGKEINDYGQPKKNKAGKVSKGSVPPQVVAVKREHALAAQKHRKAWKEAHADEIRTEWEEAFPGAPLDGISEFRERKRMRPEVAMTRWRAKWPGANPSGAEAHWDVRHPERAYAKPELPRMGYMVRLVYVREPGRARTANKGGKAATVLRALRDNLEYDREEYRDQFLSKFADFFGTEIAVLAGSPTLEQLRAAETPDRQKTLLRAAVVAAVGELPRPSYPPSASSPLSIASFFSSKKVMRCPACHVLGGRCGCDRSAIMREKAERLEEWKTKEALAWDSCAACIKGERSEAEMCEVTSCHFLGERQLCARKIAIEEEAIRDIEDLA